MHMPQNSMWRKILKNFGYLLGTKHFMIIKHYWKQKLIIYFTVRLLLAGHDFHKKCVGNIKTPSFHRVRVNELNTTKASELLKKKRKKPKPAKVSFSWAWQGFTLVGLQQFSSSGHGLAVAKGSRPPNESWIADYIYSSEKNLIIYINKNDFEVQSQHDSIVLKK